MSGHAMELSATLLFTFLTIPELGKTSLLEGQRVSCAGSRPAPAGRWGVASCAMTVQDIRNFLRNCGYWAPALLL